MLGAVESHKLVSIPYKDHGLFSVIMQNLAQFVSHVMCILATFSRFKAAMA